MLEFDDIQHILLTRAPALTGRYEFLSFRQAGGRTQVAGGHLGNGTVGRGDASLGRQEESLGDGGLHLERIAALGVDDASLATFPEEFKQGMVARAEMLGDTGENHPRSLGRKTSQPRRARDRDSVLPRRCGKSQCAVGARKTRRTMRRCRIALGVGLERDTTI